ncbi:phage portal protein [Shewanella putrefaciens]|uniref:Phage portal protein n=1 Tax=Shewanella putrefaciens TaxID=24 RepID=A0ABX8X797_SHEPU|nr:phage portal protein [Shewanella putrefaciens]AVV81948.1 portal protein [Shewanella putrefaciens]QSE47978.1 phage portal protein [Shewanella putrefaciens]QYX71381.1 phage portal protein [Shewanella putrefaciens]GGN23277.1 phage portal protein [Shewanella putrefaciens]
MSIINDALAIFAPRLALQREAAAMSYRNLKGYEAANPSRTHRAKKESRGANQAVFAAGKSLREQARWLDENHDLSIGILDRFEERVIGAQGIVVEPQPRSISGEILDELANDIQRRFATWSLRCDVTGRFSRPELERLVLRSALRDGDVFGQHVMGKVSKFGHPNEQGTQYSIEALEADFIPYESNEPSKRVRQGLEVNAWGQVVNYHVLLDHPADQVGFRYKTKAVAASNMMHLGLFKRLHQLRGVSIFHGILTRLADIKDYEESERVAARIAAALAFYIKRGDASHYVMDDAVSSREIPIAPGMTFDDLKPGEDVGMIESNRPNVHMVEFRNGQMKAVAAGSRGSYSSIARDYKGSYSSQRQELVEQDESNRIMQQWFCAGWSRPVFRNFLKMEMLNKQDPLVLPPDIDIRTLFDAVYYGPTMPWIDPRKEAEGWEMMIAANVATEADWTRARGRNPTEVKRQRKREVEYNRENHMVTANDPSLGDPNSEKNQDSNSGSSAKRNAAKRNADRARRNAEPD